MISSEGIPVHPISIRAMRSAIVMTVEVGPVTIDVPPSAFVEDSTLPTAHIITLIFSRKLHTTVKSEIKKEITFHVRKNSLNPD